MLYMLIDAIKSDKPFIYDLKKSSNFQYVNEIWGWDENYQLKDFNNSFVLLNFQIIVIGDKKVGFLELCKITDNINITEIHLLEQYRGQGIGGDIIKGILMLAEQKNKKVTLGCFKKNTRAKVLYERLGFLLKEETKTHYLLEYMPNSISVVNHYDSLIDENNDPARGPKILKEYIQMGWTSLYRRIIALS